MKKHKLASSVGVSAVAALLLTGISPLSPAFADGASEVASPVAPEIEAAEIADDLSSAPVALTNFDLRSTGPGEISGTGDVTASFPLPDNCAPTDDALELSCELGTVFLEPVVLTGEGEPLSFTTETEGKQIVVTATSNPSDNGYIFTMYAASSEAAPALPIAASTIGNMVRSDFQTGGNLPPANSYPAPAPPGTTLPATPPEPWESDEEADPSDIDDEDWDWDESIELGEDEVPTFEPPISEPGMAYGAVKRPNKVNVPKAYIYCKNESQAKCRPIARHDYCTGVANGWGKADFRGPCARHDMGIDKVSKLKISVSKKRDKRRGVDAAFVKDLKTNCTYTYYKDKKNRDKCYNTATAYFVGVNLATQVWNGK